MHDSGNQLRLVLSLTIAAAAFTAVDGSLSAADAVIAFSCDVDGIRCDGEISLRLSVTD